jgi:hypothetical protein
MANTDPTEYPDVVTITAEEIQVIADRLYVLAVSTLPVVGPADRTNLILASRTLRRLLAAYETGSGRQLAALLISGGV